MRQEAKSMNTKTTQGIQKVRVCWCWQSALQGKSEQLDAGRHA